MKSPVKYMKKNKQKGSVLVVVVGVLAVLAMMASAFLVTMQLQKAVAASSRYEAHAMMGAKCGLSYALTEIINGYNVNPSTTLNQAWHQNFVTEHPLYNSQATDAEKQIYKIYNADNLGGMLWKESVSYATDPYPEYSGSGAVGGTTRFYEYDTGEDAGKDDLYMQYAVMVNDITGKLFANNSITDPDWQDKLSHLLTYSLHNNSAYIDHYIAAYFASYGNKYPPSNVSVMQPANYSTFISSTDKIFNMPSYSELQTLALFREDLGYEIDDTFCQLLRHYVTPFGDKADVVLNNPMYTSESPALNFCTMRKAFKDALVIYSSELLCMGDPANNSDKYGIIGLDYDSAAGTGLQANDGQDVPAIASTNYYYAADQTLYPDSKYPYFTAAFTIGPLADSKAQFETSYSCLTGTPPTTTMLPLVAPKASTTNNIGTYYQADIAEALKDAFNKDSLGNPITPTSPPTSLNAIRNQFLSNLNAYTEIAKIRLNSMTWTAFTSPPPGSPIGQWSMPATPDANMQRAARMEIAVNDVLNTYFRTPSDPYYQYDFDCSSQAPAGYTQSTVNCERVNPALTLYNSYGNAAYISGTTTGSTSGSTSYTRNMTTNKLNEETAVPPIFVGKSRFYQIIVRGKCVRKKADDTKKVMAEKNLEVILEKTTTGNEYNILFKRWFDTPK